MVLILINDGPPFIGGLPERLRDQPGQASGQVGRHNDGQEDDQQIEGEQGVQAVGEQAVLDEVDFQAEPADEADDEVAGLVRVETSGRLAVCPPVQVIDAKEEGNEVEDLQGLHHFYFHARHIEGIEADDSQQRTDEVTCCRTSICLLRHRANFGAQEHEVEVKQPFQVAALQAVHIEGERPLEGEEPHAGSQRHQDDDQVDMLAQIEPYEEDEDIVDHDARDEPAAPVQDDVVDGGVAAEECAFDDGNGQDSRVDAVDAALVPVGEFADGHHRLHEQGEARTEQEQGIADGAASRQHAVLPVEQFHVGIGDQQHSQELKDVDAYISFFHTMQFSSSTYSNTWLHITIH